MPVASTDTIRRMVAGSLVSFHESHADLNFWVFAKFHCLIHDTLKDGDHTRIYADATNLTAGSRKDLRALARLLNANAHLILFRNKEEALARNTQRFTSDSETDRDAYVPESVMGKMVEAYDQTLELIELEPYDSVTVISNFDVQEQHEPPSNDSGKNQNVP